MNTNERTTIGRGPFPGSFAKETKQHTSTCLVSGNQTLFAHVLSDWKL